MTYQGDELRIMREALSIALDALIEQEKKLDPRDVDSRRRVARKIEEVSAVMVKLREQVKRYVEEA